MEQFLIVGLGNPGDRYQMTRHNLGFMVLDMMALSLNKSFSSKKYSSLYFRHELYDKNIHLIKPYTFMNLSGQAVHDAMNYLKIECDHIIVVHDDVDLAWQQLKIKYGGGNAGHKGILSLMDHLGTGDFIRVRLGVGKPLNPMLDVSDYVLMPFTNPEHLVLKEFVNQGRMAVEAILQLGLNAAMNSFNSKPKTQESKS